MDGIRGPRGFDGSASARPFGIGEGAIAPDAASGPVADVGEAFSGRLDSAGLGVDGIDAPGGWSHGLDGVDDIGAHLFADAGSVDRSAGARPIALPLLDGVDLGTDWDLAGPTMLAGVGPIPVGSGGIEGAPTLDGVDDLAFWGDDVGLSDQPHMLPRNLNGLDGVDAISEVDLEGFSASLSGPAPGFGAPGAGPDRAVYDGIELDLRYAAEDGVDLGVHGNSFDGDEGASGDDVAGAPSPSFLAPAGYDGRSDGVADDLVTVALPEDSVPDGIDAEPLPMAAASA